MTLRSNNSIIFWDTWGPPTSTSPFATQNNFAFILPAPCYDCGGILHSFLNPFSPFPSSRCFLFPEIPSLWDLLSLLVWQYVVERAAYICDLYKIRIRGSCPVIDTIIRLQRITITTAPHYATLFPSPQPLILKYSSVPHYHPISPFFTSAF